jgi:hypothetical protein
MEGKQHCRLNKANVDAGGVTFKINRKGVNCLEFIAEMLYNTHCI